MNDSSDEGTVKQIPTDEKSPFEVSMDTPELTPHVFLSGPTHTFGQMNEQTAENEEQILSFGASSPVNIEVLHKDFEHEKRSQSQKRNYRHPISRTKESFDD